ncbi:ABC transporter substrate-binding protein [Aquibacillus salsiterrae]|uniref:ABC transporter substrate-binding protein n=1 Tax=Aquibacillus salsiterrae TaxID=2950439 RepID=A0A9X3WE87_9BACI|nr:ABC transporter substrate-binding protein [Aquibacillus salsiterrae]MDC3415814.1 ABC transporter substrate-binding protein [Aquibacillus salsiterrae]
MRIKTIIVIMSITLIIVGCRPTSATIQLEEYESTVQTFDQETKADSTLTIWATEDIFSYAVEQFNQKYPNINIEIIKIDRRELVETYMDSIVNQKTPDIFMIEDRYLGAFTGINGLENLYEEPYFANETLQFFSPDLVKNYTQFANEDFLFALPFMHFPYVTYYRADILEEEGFPSDPVQLANFIKTTDNWLEMGAKLKENGHYMMDTNHSLLSILNSTTYYFDDELNYLANNQGVREVAKAINLAVESNLESKVNIWNEDGTTALAEDKQVMFYLPSYGVDLLKTWVPNQSGKWRITQLPLGMNGLDKETGRSLAISSFSNQKKLAWEFIQLTAKQMSGMYQYSDQNSFFGYQDVNEIFNKIMNKPSQGRSTPLDHYAYDVWDLNIYPIVMGNPITLEILDDIEQSINELTRIEKRAIKGVTEGTAGGD